MGLSLISQTVTFLKGDGVGKAQGKGVVRCLPLFSHRSPSLWTPHLCCRLAFDQRSHTLSRGIDKREKRERGLDEEWRMGQFQFAVTLTNLGYIP